MKKLQKDSKNKGFTLIEVVIVLAIGALIILVVVQAIGAARRSQRDSARKQEAARVAGLLEQMASNSPTGSYPADATALDTAIDEYDAQIGGQYSFQAMGLCSATGPSDYEIGYEAFASSGGMTIYKDYDLEVCLEAGDTADLSLDPTAAPAAPGASP